MSDPIAQTPLAIVGIACRLPGADGIEEFWNLLRDGIDAVDELPADRLDRDLYYETAKGVRGKTYSTRGGIVSDRPLDRTVCPLDDTALRNADPCHAILCETAGLALRDAGYDRLAAKTRNVGTYIGHSGGSPLSGEISFATHAAAIVERLRDVDAFGQLNSADQEAIIADVTQAVRESRPRRTPDGGPHVEAGEAAALIARTFQFDGPHLVIDAACASSLVALHSAALALQRGSIDAAVVGGASYAKADSLVLFSHAQSCSAHKSRPFDDNADGLIGSEGYVVIVVKTLDQAKADGDRIHAVIRGIGMSADGRGRSLWAPRKEGQLEAVRRAYCDDLDPATIQYVEMHATSTQLGDATEIEALADFFRDKPTAARRIPIGSVKSNLGHTLETAGLAGLLKTVLALKFGRLPASINIRSLNRSVDWQRAPFEVVRELQPWPMPQPGVPRRAAINAFGIGGLNVHVVVEECAVQPVADGTDSSTPNESSAAPKDEDAVAIIGRGVVLPGATSVAAFGDLLEAGTDAKSEPDERRWRLAFGHDPTGRHRHGRHTALGGYVRDYRYDWRRHKIPPKQIETANPLQFMLLDAADQALDEAQAGKRPLDRSRTHVVVGSIFGGDFGLQLIAGLRLPELRAKLLQACERRGIAPSQSARLADGFAARILRDYPALVDETGSFTSSTLASRITKTLDLMGGAQAVDVGCCSGTAALGIAVDLLTTGRASTVLCAAAQQAMTQAVFELLELTGELADSKPQAAFDAGAQGWVPGEGVVTLVLKRLSDARRDGDRIFGILRGVGSAANVECTESSVRKAARRSFSGLESFSSQVARLELGSGDREREFAALRALVDESQERAAPIEVSSLIAQIGNLQGAAGLAALVRITLEYERRRLTPTFGLRQAAEEMAEFGKRVRVVTAASPLGPVDARHPRQAAVVVCAKGGLTHHVLIEEPTSVTTTQPSPAPILDKPKSNSGSARLFRFGATEISGLAASLEKADVAACWSAAAPPAFSTAHTFRAAFVAHSADELQTQLRAAAAELPNVAKYERLERSGIYLANAGARPLRAVALFPGQGSHYANMGVDLVRHCSAAAAIGAEADAWLSGRSLPPFSQLVSADAAATKDPLRAQLAVIAADVANFAAVHDQGFNVDAVCGHSLGEFAALVAAGAWNLSAAFSAVVERQVRVAECGLRPSAVIAVSASPADLTSFLRDAQTDRLAISVSHYNAPRQTVVAGEAADVESFASRLREANFALQRIDVPYPYHTDLLQSAVTPLREALDGIPMNPPRIPFISHVSLRFTAEPAELRDNLARQLTEPVRYVDLIGRLERDGYNLFLELGPRSTLTGFHRRILEGKNARCFAVDESQSWNERIVHLQALWECLGGVVATATAGTSAWGPAIAVTSPMPIETFDATLVRRQRMREAAGRQSIELPRLSTRSVPLEEFDGTAVRRSRNATQARGESPLPMVAALKREAPLPPVVSPQHEVGATDDAALHKFLINFVVEQTGYPSEIVELDADLEADLGIDSIKKAQLFGELREYFEMPARSDLKLSDFPTLRHVADFLRGATGKGDWLGAGQAADDVGAYPVASAELPESALVGSAAPIAAPASDENALAAFLINFVVEQTGYPVEIVELDADLEADLGIDSIKKAQIFGELREHFTLAVSGDMKLSDFPTLRHFVDLLKYAMPTASSLSASEARGVATPLPAPSSFVNADESSPDDSSESEDANDIPVLRLTSASYYDGLARGQKQREELRAWLYNRADQLSNGEIAVATISALSEDRADLLRGMAVGAGLALGNIISWHEANGMGHREMPTLLESYGVPSTDEESVGLDAQVDESAAMATAAQSMQTKRFVMRLVDKPRRKSRFTKFAPPGAAAILGNNPTANALADRLSQRGIIVYRLPNDDDPQTAITALEAAWRKGPVGQLYLLTARDADAATQFDASHTRRRHARGVLGPYFLCRHWAKLIADAEMTNEAVLVACTSLGGDFGLSRQVVSAESGALTGLLKAVFIENWVQGYRRGPIKIIDAPPHEEPAQLAEEILLELTVPAYDWEVSFREGRRQVLTAVSQECRPSLRQTPRRGAVWVCTGGARGITHLTARTLAERYGLRLHLLGTAPRPTIPESWHELSETGLRKLREAVMKQPRAAGETPIDHWQKTEKAIEIDRNLRDLAAAGISVTYHSCNIADHAALARVLDDIRRTDGPIDGVLHGAGVGKDARFDRKDPRKVKECYGAKVDGAANLMDLTRDDPLRHFIAFGSISGRFGANGHTDYSSANDMLAKQMDWFRGQRPECSSIAFHWHAWGDVGMAMKAETKLALELVDMQFMPAREGLMHLIQELESEMPEAEVLITDDRYFRKFYRKTRLDSDVIGDGRSPAAEFPEAMLAASVTTHARESTTFEISLDPLREVFLQEHRLDDRPLLPVVVGMELLAEAARGHRLTPQSLYDVRAVAGLRFHTDRPQAIRLHANSAPEGGCNVALTADFLARDGRLVEADRVYLSGRVDPNRQFMPRPVPPPPGDDWHAVSYAPAGSKFFLGLPLRGCYQVQVCNDEAWGRILAPPLVELAGSRRGAEQWLVPSAVIDACLYAVGLFAWHRVRPGAALPKQFGAVHWGRFPDAGESCLVYARLLRQTSTEATFDFTLVGCDGEFIAAAEAYTIVWLGSG